MKQYKDEMDALRFTEAQKQDMVTHLLDAQEEKHTMKPFKTRRFVAAGVAAALCLTVTGFALPNSPMRKLASEVFAGILGGDAQMVDALGAPIGVSATDNGVTVTADAVLGDESNLCIVYSLSREDGKPFNMEGDVRRLMFESSEQSLYTMGKGGHGSFYFTDTDTTDAAVQYVQTVSLVGMDSGLRGKTATVTLQNLMRSDANNSQMLTEGTWKLAVPLDYTDVTQHFDDGQTLRVADKDFHVTKIALSPLGYRIELESDEAIPYEEEAGDVTTAVMGGSVGITPEDGERAAPAGNGRKEYYDDLAAVLQLRDGSTLDLTQGGGGMNHLEDGRLQIYKSGTFEQLIAMEELQTLTLGDVVIDLQ